MSTDFDLIVIGGGCAGLSLASRLSRFGAAAPRTLVLDQRASYQNDRTWSFWQLPGTEAARLVQRRWRAFRVVSEEHSVLADCASQPYCAIPASRFYEDALRKLEASQRVRLLSGVGVQGAARQRGTAWEVQTAQGTVTAKSIVDTRPTRPPRTGDALLWQTFVGAEVEFAEGRFDTQVVTLMDFRESPRGRIVFTYVLPFTATRGLVEVTEFSPLAQPPAQLNPLLQHALQRIAGGACYQTLRSEAGSLPMGLIGNAPRTVAAQGGSGSCVQAGVAGGGVRAATGYAFQRIQQWASLCAASVAAKGLPIGHPADPPSIALLDHLFLQVLREDPHQAPALFTQLFATAPTSAVVRFLSDRPSIFDLLQVVCGLPAGPFVKKLAGMCIGRASALRESFVS